MAVLDSSFAAKLVLREKCSGAALKELEEMAARAEELHAPCTLVLEVARALQRHVKTRGDMSVEEAMRALQRLKRLLSIVHLHPAEELVGDALELALQHGLAVSEAFYVVLARSLNQPLYTFDNRLAARARGLAAVVVPECEEES